MMAKSLSGANDNEETRRGLAGKSMEKSAKFMYSARLLLNGGLPDQAVDRLYYSLFFVAKAALFLRGKDPVTHNGVKAELIKLLKSELSGIMSEHEINSLVGFYGDRERLRNEMTYSLTGESECLNAADVEETMAEAMLWIESVAGTLCGLVNGEYAEMVGSAAGEGSS
jgi:uncharacterized protein (UPF0332 family)